MASHAAQYKIKSYLGTSSFQPMLPMSQTKSLHKIKFQEAKIDVEHISFHRNLVPCGIIEK
jgi:hypothetical protein